MYPHKIDRIYDSLCTGMLYCIGGWHFGHNVPNERYDEAKDEWMEIAPLNHPRSGVAAVAHNGLIYAIGGIVNINCFIDLQPAFYQNRV